MGWYVEDILAEYTSYAEPKVREVDVKWINRFRSESFITIETAEHAADGVSTRTGHDMKKMVKMLFIAVLVIGVVGLVYLHENGIYSHA